MNSIFELMNQTEVTDICINGEHSIYFDAGRGMEVLEGKKPPTQNEIKSWVLNELSRIGKSWDARYPFVDATLASGFRLHVVLDGIAARTPMVSLRRLSSQTKRTFWKDTAEFHFLKEQVKAHKTIIVSGATGSGKTTLINELIDEIPHHERILALEDTPELFPNHPHFLSLNSRPSNADGFGEITLSQCLKQTLRMRPDRIILGECRGAEVLDLLQSLNTGHRGTLATLHAHSPREALRRIELLCMLALKGNLPLIFVRELIALGIEFVVQVERTDAGRKITSIQKIEGREGETILMREVKVNH